MRLSKIKGALVGVMTFQLVMSNPLPETRTIQKIESAKIPFSTQYVFSREVGKGRLLTKQKGQPGSVKRVYELRTKNGKSVRTLLSTERTEAKPEIILMGTSGYPSSRGSFDRGRVMTMTATAYYPTDGSPQGLTASGIKAKYGVVAVDPRVIKLGTKVYVEGYGFAIAADTGGAIKGNKIDLCMHDRGAIYNFGRRKVRVHILR
ncbi:MAG: G5 domain-containing protein [Chthonomonas sp.]|nr:G5 domain-containing protein [Chthonomonas sp.]